MPIFYKIYKEENLIISKFIGKVTDSEMLDAYTDLFQDELWANTLNELTDLSQLDGVEMSTQGLRRLSVFIGDTLKKRGARPKVAIYAPSDLAYGLARVYSVYSEGFEDNQVFRDLGDAKHWLSKPAARPEHASEGLSTEAVVE